MTKEERVAIVSIPVVLVVGALVGWAGSEAGREILTIPAFGFLYALAFVMQWLAFIPSYLFHDERFFDITGSLTYVSVVAIAVGCSRPMDLRTGLLLGLIVIWAARLGIFLLQRVRRAGKDERFDSIKRSFSRLLLTWTLQGLWVSLTLAAALAAITTNVRQPLGIAAFVGLFLWVCGFGIEVVADRQKRRFRSDPADASEFIHSGLWTWSRHPNYFGEILLWIGIAVLAAPVLRGWQWATIISPAFVTVLLTRVSGIPMLENRADKKWGGREDYRRYKARTSVLIPRPPRRDIN